MKYFFLFFLIICSAVNAQVKNEVGIIQGNVLEVETGKALAEATVTLRKMGDSLSVKKMLTDKNGNFEFDNLSVGFYQLAFTNIGFSGTTIDSINVRAERSDFNLSDIKLSRSSALLQEVIIYAEKPLIENKDGKITYNVGESALSSGSSTAEILKNMPLISNDPEGKILMKGKEPKILIDDKPTDLNTQQLADLLESLPGSSIERIELMSNPPPQYASEAGGVINIVTKKGKVGVVGRVTISAGSRGEGKIGANISYRHKKFTLNANAGFAINNFTGDNYSRRENYYKDSTNYFHTDGNFVTKNIRPNLRVQGDYDVNKNHSFNAVFQSNFNLFENESNTQFKNLNRFNSIYRLSNRSNLSDGTGYTNGVSFTYTYKSTKSAERLQVIASADRGKNDNDKDFLQQFLDPFYFPTGIDSLQQQAFDYKNQSLQFRVNYDKPLAWKGASISTGASFNQVNNHNVLNTRFFKKAQQEFVNNDMLSNDFKFLQNVAAVRGSFTYKFKHELRFTAGVQVEQTENNFQFLKGNVPDVTTTYINWLPNATIRKEFNKMLNSTLVYRATIRRPGINELNPNIDYSDPYNLRFGNPYLLPSLAHTFDWNVGFTKGKYYVNTSFGYNKVQDVFNTIRTLVDNGITEVSYQNIADRQEYEGSAWGGYTFNKRFRMNGSLGYTYNQYGEEEKLLYKYRNGGTFYTSLNYNYTPTSLLMFEGNARYSSFADPQGRARSNLNMSFGVQRKLMNKRLIVSFNIIDPLLAQKLVTYTYGSRFTLENYRSTNTRNFRLTIAYQLNQIVKSKISEKQKQEMLRKVQGN